MDNAIFKKMKVKDGMSFIVINKPQDYPEAENLIPSVGGQADFVHLFVKSREDFENCVKSAVENRKPDGLLWISYPKSKGKIIYDINRDSMWDLSIPYGVHPVAQVALDDCWSALRFMDNKPGEEYARPIKK